MKKIPLSRGKVAIVDDKDYEELSKHKWFASKAYRRDVYYAARNRLPKGSRPAHIQMHRQIMNPPDGLQVDHINGDGLDNRRGNLRIVTAAENTRNQRLSKRNSSGFRGVYAKGKKWEAMATHDYQYHYLGLFEDKTDAAIAFDLFILASSGEDYRTNIIKFVT